MRKLPKDKVFFMNISNKAIYLISRKRGQDRNNVNKGISMFYAYRDGFTSLLVPV